MHIAIISFSPFVRDPRVYRQASTLNKAGHQVTVISESPSHETEIDFIPLSGSRKASLPERSARAALMFSSAFKTAYWMNRDVLDAEAALRKTPFDLILANDVESLPVAFEVAGTRPVVVDLHEHAPSQGSSSLLRRMTSQRFKLWLCREYLSRVSAATTVSVGIARAYADQFNIPEPTVIRSLPNRCAITESPVDESNIKIAYHGLAGPGRGLEELISSTSLWNPGRTLHLMLVESDRRYFAKLHERVKEMDRVEIVAPVTMRGIVERINEFDIGIYVNTASGPQGQFAMPNKIFEYIQARLAVVVANSIEAGALVTEWSCGVALPSTDPLDLAEHLNLLTRETVEKLKSASEVAAHSLCWENEEVKLLNVVKYVMAG